jgi:hypothetical protein
MNSFIFYIYKILKYYINPSVRVFSQYLFFFSFFHFKFFVYNPAQKKSDTFFLRLHMDSSLSQLVHTALTLDSKEGMTIWLFPFSSEEFWIVLSLVILSFPSSSSSLQLYLKTYTENSLPIRASLSLCREKNGNIKLSNNIGVGVSKKMIIVK